MFEAISEIVGNFAQLSSQDSFKMELSPATLTDVVYILSCQLQDSASLYALCSFLLLSKRSTLCSSLDPISVLCLLIHTNPPPWALHQLPTDSPPNSVVSRLTLLLMKVKHMDRCLEQCACAQAQEMITRESSSGFIGI